MRETSKRLALIHWSLASQYVSDIELAWPNEWDEVVSFFTFPFSAPIWCILWRWASPRKRKRKRSGTWAAEVVPHAACQYTTTRRYLLWMLYQAGREAVDCGQGLYGPSLCEHPDFLSFLFLYWPGLENPAAKRWPSGHPGQRKRKRRKESKFLSH